MKAILVLLVAVLYREITGDDQCEEILAPMCRGFLRYRKTKMPNMFGHTTQAQAYRRMERYWANMDLSCSNNFRSTICGVYFPECKTKGTTVSVKLPCREGCLYAKKECRRAFSSYNMAWPTKVLKCKQLPRKKSKNCVKPYKKLKKPRDRQHNFCQPNQIELCNGFNISKVSLPNFFQQDDPQMISTELENYRQLLRSNCSPNLRFFICGVYQSWCPSNNRPIVLPCRQVCEEVKASCEATYRRLYNGLKWPAKFQCHRYPLPNSTVYPCKASDTITPDDEVPFRG